MTAPPTTPPADPGPLFSRPPPPAPMKPKASEVLQAFETQDTDLNSNVFYVHQAKGGGVRMTINGMEIHGVRDVVIEHGVRTTRVSFVVPT